MDLGLFSLSLAVKDIHASKSFYEKLGFTAMGGDIDQNWLILQGSGMTLGLFQGMFDSNIMTFNPGWGPGAAALSDFDDVRALQAAFEADGLELVKRADPEGTGPDHLILTDPDGNTIMLDQHV